MTPVNILAIRHFAKRIAKRIGGTRAMSPAGMRAAAWLMPHTAGQEWLAEARGVLFDAPPHARNAITRSYLLAAPEVFAAAWGSVLTGRLRAAWDTWTPGEGKR